MVTLEDFREQLQEQRTRATELQQELAQVLSDYDKLFTEVERRVGKKGGKKRERPKQNFNEVPFSDDDIPF